MPARTETYECDEPDDLSFQGNVLETTEILEPCGVFAVDMAAAYRHFKVSQQLLPESVKAMRLQLVEASPQFRQCLGRVHHMNISEPARLRPFAVVTPACGAEIADELGRGEYIAPVWVLRNLIECQSYCLSHFVKWSGDLNLVFVHGHKNVPVAVSFWYRAHQLYPGWWMHARSVNSRYQYPAGTRVFQGIELEEYGDFD